MKGFVVGVIVGLVLYYICDYKDTPEVDKVIHINEVGRIEYTPSVIMSNHDGTYRVYIGGTDSIE